MIAEKSCGAIVFTQEQGIVKYLIIRSKEGIYGFPKGHVETGETEIQTVLREILEETGLTVQLHPDFRVEDVYTFHRNQKGIEKHVVYFLGEYAAQTPVSQEAEVSSILLMNYDEAMEMLQFENTKRWLTEAHNFLRGAK